MRIRHALTLDLQQCDDAPVVHVKQGDCLTRELLIHLTDNATPWNPPEEAIYQVAYCKMDRCGGCYDSLPDGTLACYAEEVGLVLRIHPQMLTVPGPVICELRMLNEAGAQLSTFSFFLNVEPAATSGIESADYYRFTSLDQLRSAIGDLRDLQTEDKSSLIAALNELKQSPLPEDILLYSTQNLNVSQQAQARRNISAASANHTHAYSELQELPTISVNGGNADTVGGKTVVEITREASSSAMNAMRNALQEAKESGEFDGKTPEKGVDYFTEADKVEMVERVRTSMGDVPDYWQAALDEGAEAINTALCNAGRNKSAFLFYSDTHWNYGSGMAPALLKHLYQHTGMNKTFFGGDIVNDEATDYDTMEYLWDWRRQLRGLPNHHSVPGNHDDGNSTNNLFSEEYVYGYLLASEETADMVCGDKGLYYYVDNPAEKTRYLCLDTGFKDASALSDDQKEFIKASLKSVPAGWHVVVVAHIWYGLDYDQYDKRPVPVAGLSATASSVLAILDNYNSRSGEFSECGGWVEFCIGGHIHYDYDAASATGIPIILVETDSHHTRGRYTATVGTATESAVSGIVADYSAHKIHVIRIGRGANREVEVTNYVVSYTNVLPRALAADGVSVYNADDTPGYKADTRWSSSSNAEGSSTGTYITGWIPVKAGDVIRLKNITMPHLHGNTCMIHYFDNSFTTANNNISVNTGFTVEKYAIVKDENNNVVQFTTPANAPFTHIRIQCGGIDDTSIITINEPIE